MAANVLRVLGCAPVFVFLTLASCDSNPVDPGDDGGVQEDAGGRADAGTAADAGASEDAGITPTDAGPLPPDVLFFSDWRTATGTSLEALTDGSKWTDISANSDSNGEVIPNPGDLGFPVSMTNILRVATDGTRDGWFEPKVRGLPIPMVGQSRYYRWYFRNAQPDGLEDSGTHPIQDADESAAGSQVNWSFNVVDSNPLFGLSPGEWGILFMNQNPTWDDSRWNLGARAEQLTPLSKDRTYRFELHLLRNSDATFILDARVYDESISATEPLYDGADFNNNVGTRNLTGGHENPINTLANMGGITAGLNGIGNAAAPHGWPLVYAYQGGFCIRADDWCGAYQGSF